MKAATPLVSVITVCRNARTRICACIDSVRRQTLSPKAIEHIVVDGLSDDGTAEMVRDAARDGRIHDYVSEKDGGIYDAMNKGLRLARGKYVVFLNSDDWYMPDMLARSLRSADDAQADYVFSDAWAYEPTGGRVFRFRADLDSLSWEVPYAHPTLLCRRSVYDQLGGYDTTFRIAGDYDLMWRLRRLPASHAVLRASLACYRLGGLSANDDYGEILTIYARNGDVIGDSLRTSRLALLGFLASGTLRLGQALEKCSLTDRGLLLHRAQDVYLQIGVLEAIRRHRMENVWIESLGGVIAASEAGERMSARFGTVARRLRIRYVLRRHGLMAAVMAAGSQARVWMRRCGVRT